MEFLDSVREDPGAAEIFRDFRFDGFLGRGGFARVFKAYNHLDEVHYAVKIFAKSERKSSTSNRVMRNEVDILKRLRNENVIRLVQYLETKCFIFAIMDYCENGDLWHLLARYNRVHGSQGMSEKLVSQIVRQILKGMQFLHSNFLIHRDLKPENVLVKNFEGWDALPPNTIKLADFGLCKDMGSPFSISLSLKCGTDAYMAPELIKKETYGYVDLTHRATRRLCSGPHRTHLADGQASLQD